jgi:hypothetical protein
MLTLLFHQSPVVVSSSLLLRLQNEGLFVQMGGKAT